MKPKDLGMTELRALASDLEHLLEREIKGTRKKDLVPLVDEALAELPPDVLTEILKNHGMVEAKDSEVIPKVTAEEAFSTRDRLLVAPQVTNEEVSPEEEDEEEEELPPAIAAPPVVRPIAEKTDLPFAIQIREWPMGYALSYGDIVRRPDVDEEAFERYSRLVGGVTHAALNEDGFKRLVARGSRVKNL